MEWKFELTEKEFQQCDEFANNSSKSQREHRSGGTFIRNYNQIKENTLRGKVGETIVKKFLEQKGLEINSIKLDFDIYPRGKWDETDIKLNGKTLSIKSSKWFSRWLLLESKDILRGDVDDYYILVLVDRDFKSGEIKGFATKDEIIKPNGKTLILKKGENIPLTTTTLDADNHARNFNDLDNSEKGWKKLVKKLQHTL